MDKKKVLKIVGLVLGAVLVFFIGAAIGSSGAKITLDEKVLELSTIDQEIEAMAADRDERKADIEEEITSLEEEKKGVAKEISTLQDEKSATEALIKDKEQIEDDLTETKGKLSDIEAELEKELAEGRKEVEAELESLNADLASLKEEIAVKQSELDTIVGGIKEKKDAPKILPAGYFVVGVDIPSGRYKVTTNGTSGSNFVVYGSNGSLEVNTIISNRNDFGVKEYVVWLSDGMIIDASDTFKYVPVE
ncbi:MULTISPECIES: hypothetical protein [unclassified Sutcliffiella]|uniref:hypothetical protein n=1 Tax=unclassified Sutcliffiella TaxID=2837532 RepID=UPI0030CF5EC5